MNVGIIFHDRVDLTMDGQAEEGGVQGGRVADDEDRDIVDGGGDVTDLVTASSDQNDHLIVANTLHHLSHSTAHTGPEMLGRKVRKLVMPRSISVTLDHQSPGEESSQTVHLCCCLSLWWWATLPSLSLPLTEC